MSYAAAYTIWVIFSILLLLLTVRLLWPYMAELKNLWAPLPLLGFLAFFPVFVDLLQGQDSVLLLLVFTLVFISLKKGREFTGGLVLAIALLKFQYALPFLFPFVLWRRWRFVGGFAVSSAGLFLLSLPVAGFRGTLSYATFLSNLLKGVSSHRVQYSLGFLPNTVPNIRGAVEMLAPSLLPQTFHKPLIVLISGLAVLWLARRGPLGRSLTEKTFDLGFSLALVVSILVSYYLHLHDLSLLLIPFVLVMNRLLKGEICTGRRRLLMVGIILLFFLSPLYLLLLRHRLIYLLFWPILAFFVMLSWELRFPSKVAEAPGRENLSRSIADET